MSRENSRTAYALPHLLLLLKRIIRFMWDEERKLCIISIITGVIWPVLGLVQPLLMGRLIDNITTGNHDAAYKLLAVWAVIIALFVATLYVNRLTSDIVKHRLKTKVGERFMQRALTLGYDFYAGVNSGWLLKVMTRGDEALANQAHEMLGWIVGYLVILVLVIPTVLYLNVWGGLLVIGMLCAIVMCLRYIFNQSALKQVKLERMMNRLYGEAGDAFANAIPLQSYSGVGWVTQRFTRLLQRRLRLQLPILNWWALANSFVGSAERMAIIGIATAGIYLITQDQLTPGELVSFILLISYSLPHLVSLYERFQGLFWQQPYLNDLFDILDAQPAIVDKPDATDLTDAKGHVKFENISFSYPQSGRTVLSDISFEIKPGQTVALVGATGSGKTSIARLLMRYYDPSEGTISIDGVPLEKIKLESLRAVITVLFQESFVLNQNVTNNLRLGRSDKTKEQVGKSMDDSLFTDVLNNMPKGLSTKLGERGVKISGGERQRLAIARAVLRDTPVLILDEATSALDAATEAVLRESLNKLTKDRTTLIIAHRLSTIRHADEILVLKKGQIAERGSYKQLVKLGGVFSKLVASQQDGVVGDTANPLSETLNEPELPPA